MQIRAGLDLRFFFFYSFAAKAAPQLFDIFSSKNTAAFTPANAVIKYPQFTVFFYGFNQWVVRLPEDLSLISRGAGPRMRIVLINVDILINADKLRHDKPGSSAFSRMFFFHLGVSGYRTARCQCQIWIPQGKISK